MFFEILILALGFLVGLLISYMARDELKLGRNWFKLLIVFSFIGIVVFWFFEFSEIAWTFGFMGIVTFVSLIARFK